MSDQAYLSWRVLDIDGKITLQFFKNSELFLNIAAIEPAEALRLAGSIVGVVDSLIGTRLKGLDSQPVENNHPELEIISPG